MGAVFLFLASASASAQEPGDAGAVLRRLQQRYEQTPDFTAHFRQETQLKTLGRTFKARGKVYFQRPGKMLWRFEEPKGEYLLSDGKSFYYYQPQQKQVLKRPLKGAFRSDIPLSFMLGLGNIERDFNGILKRGEKGEHVLELFPKGEGSGFGELVLGVDPQSYDVIWAQIKDAVGGIISVRFSDIKRGVGLKDSLFRPEIPGGVDVVELGQ